MKTSTPYKNTLFIICCFSVITARAQVKDWFLAGNDPKSYQIGVETETERNGKVAYLKSIKEPEKGKFGTIMQGFNPEEYKGKRVRLSGYIKSQDVRSRAGMWFRVDGPEYGRSLGFDNMQDRAIKGTTGWKQYEIILDVPQNATAIAYGVLVSGAGAVWIDDLKFEVVSSSVPVTDMFNRTRRPTKPQNANFEEGN